jgi:hypothetical protein
MVVMTIAAEIPGRVYSAVHARLGIEDLEPIPRFAAHLDT